MSSPRTERGDPSRPWRLLDGLIELCGYVAGLLLAAIALGVTADIIGRNLRIASFTWVIELAEYALLAVTFLGAPWVLKHSGHVSVDIVVQQLPSRLHHAAARIADGIGLAVCVIILWAGIEVTFDLYQRDTQIHKILSVKAWWLVSVVPFSCALMAIEFARRLGRSRDASVAGREAGF